MSLFALPHTGFRVQGQYVRGEWESTRTPMTFLGTVQPLTAKDMNPSDVARQDLGRVKVYASSPLHVGEQGTEYSGDVISWGERYWEIVQELPHQSGIVPHWKYIAELRPGFAP